ncbi:MAG: dihydrofolate reductase [Roseivirga sp.]|nr:dihydrofolate reductase [Roseivirga sp.]
MKKLILYIATSLDGKIAGPDDDVKWLEELPNPDKSDYGYFDFYAGVDTTIMGNTTYQWIKRQDMPFPYGGKQNYVLTRNGSLKDNEEVTFLSDDIAQRITELKREEGKDIWLIGGAGVNQFCLEANLIDEIRVFVMPIILGEGVSLFADGYDRQQLRLTSSTAYSSGVCELRYSVNNE